MSTFFVSLASIDDVKQFVDAATRCPCEVDVRSGRYLVNYHGPLLSGAVQARGGGGPGD